MSKLSSLKPVVGRLQQRALGNAAIPLRADVKRTLTGRALQATRFRLWKASPYCAKCGRLLDYPRGFELDHIVRVELNGGDEDSNLQLLCVDEFDRNKGCHAVKTLQEEKDRRGDRL